MEGVKSVPLRSIFKDFEDFGASTGVSRGRRGLETGGEEGVQNDACQVPRGGQKEGKRNREVPTRLLTPRGRRIPTSL